MKRSNKRGHEMKNTMYATNKEKKEELILAIVLVLDTCLRKGELLNIKYSDISNGCLRLSYSKNRVNHLVRYTIPLSNTLQHKIKKHQLAFSQNEYVFNKLRKNKNNLKTTYSRQKHFEQFIAEIGAKVCHLDSKGT
jgi:integrase